MITLGGTIDALPYPLEECSYPGMAIGAGDNAAFKALQSLCDQHTELTQIKLCNKDSKDLIDHDIQLLNGYINGASGYERIIVTMGTDKMRDTALAVQSAERLALPCCLYRRYLADQQWPSAK